MSALHIQLPEPLDGLKGSCEIHCVAGCCGLDAFEIVAKNMVPWLNEQSVETGLRALNQLEDLMASVHAHAGGEVWSEENDFNAVWETTRECLDFLNGWFGEAVQALFIVNGKRLVHPSWLAWNDSTVPKIARAIHDECVFDRLPILADALEEAGCADVALLSHCRGSGPHVRGCWVVDLLLTKE